MGGLGASARLKRPSAVAVTGEDLGDGSRAVVPPPRTHRLRDTWHQHQHVPEDMPLDQTAGLVALLGCLGSQRAWCRPTAQVGGAVAGSKGALTPRTSEDGPTQVQWCVAGKGLGSARQSKGQSRWHMPEALGRHRLPVEVALLGKPRGPAAGTEDGGDGDPRGHTVTQEKL